MQLINYNNANQFMAYHNVPSKQGTPDFEHKLMVPLASVTNGKRMDGADDPDTLVVACPVPGCGTTSWVPLTGSSEAQELHARVRHQRAQQPTLPKARDSVAADVTARGGAPASSPPGP